MKGYPMGQSEKFQKKSHSAEKNLEKHLDSQRGDPLCFRVSGRRFCLFWRGSEVSSV